MDNIKVLEKIGLEKVSEETHIEEKYLKFMIDMEYDKLDHVNTVGFVKILSREYKLDLSAWSEAFEEYWVENREAQEDSGFFVSIPETKKSKKPLVLTLLVIAGVVFSILFSIFQDKIDTTNYTSSNETIYEPTAIVQEAQESLNEANSSLEENATQESMFDETNSSEVMLSIDENSTEKTTKEDANETNSTQDVAEEVKIEISEPIAPAKKVSQSFSQEATITSSSRLWIGVIYLDNKKRRSFLGEGNFSIDMSRDQIISTGHGSFDMTIDDEKKEFNRKGPMKFLVKDSKLTEISSDKFKELNEGKFW